MTRFPHQPRRQDDRHFDGETNLITSSGLLCGTSDTYRQSLLSDLQSHLCNDTARLVYEYSVCNKACGLRGKGGDKQCCSCRDIRPFNPNTEQVTVRVYVDGKGYIYQSVPRSKWYCPQCRTQEAEKQEPVEAQTEAEAAGPEQQQPEEEQQDEQQAQL